VGERLCHLGDEDNAGYGSTNHCRKEACHTNHKKIDDKVRGSSKQPGRQCAVKGSQRTADGEHGEEYSSCSTRTETQRRKQELSGKEKKNACRRHASVSQVLDHFVSASEYGGKEGADAQNRRRGKDYTKTRGNRKPAVIFLRIEDHPAEQRASRTAQDAEDQEMAVMAQGNGIGDRK